MTWLPGAAAAPRALRLERRDLEALLRERGLLSALDQLLDAVLAAGRAEGLDLDQIDAVLPVGGSSRIPLIRQWLSERCPAVPLRDERPIEAVALGALALTPGVQVKDVLARGSPCAAGIGAASSTAGIPSSWPARAGPRAGRWRWFWPAAAMGRRNWSSPWGSPATINALRWCSSTVCPSCAAGQRGPRRGALGRPQPAAGAGSAGPAGGRPLAAALQHRRGGPVGARKRRPDHR